MLRHRSSMSVTGATRRPALPLRQRSAVPRPSRSIPSPTPMDSSDSEATFSDAQQAEEATLPFPSDHELIDCVKTATGGVVKPNSTVELHDGAFLRVVFVTRDSTHQVHLRGILLMRHRDVDAKINPDSGDKLHSLLPLPKNELCAVLKVTAGTRSLNFESSLISRPLKDVLLLREVLFTNAEFPEHSDWIQGRTYGNSELKEEQGNLVCRWKYLEEIDRKRKKVGFNLMQLEEYESDPGKGISRPRKFMQFRGEPVTKLQNPVEDCVEVSEDDSAASTKRKHEIINLISDDECQNDRRRKRSRGLCVEELEEKIVKIVDSDGSEEEFSYTTTCRCQKKGKRRVAGQTFHKKYIYADMCAGAGGMARGAAMAGLKIKYLLECEADACSALTLNFGADVVLKMDITDFAKSGTTQDIGGYFVDVMHFSLPCQGHSSANRGLNPERDAVNIALGYGILTQILQRCKPRIITLEQVEGVMTRSDGGQHLRAQIAELTAANYSCRWRRNNLAEYGNAHARRRVIIIAACPGQILPRWPKPTHGDGPGLKPFVTIRDILRQVPSRLDGIMGSATKRNEPSYPANTVLKGCITASGGKANLHPSGKSTFNLQQLAQLQGLPSFHRFSGGKTAVGKQIGNLVPAVFAKVLFAKSVIPALKATDAELDAYQTDIQRKNEEARRNPILL